MDADTQRCPRECGWPRDETPPGDWVSRTESCTGTLLEVNSFYSWRRDMTALRDLSPEVTRLEIETFRASFPIRTNHSIVFHT